MYYILQRVCYIMFIILIAGALIENLLSSKIYAENKETIENIYIKCNEKIKNVYKIYEENKLENFCGITSVPWTTLLFMFLAMVTIYFFMLGPIIRRICYVFRCCLIGYPIIISNPHSYTNKTYRPKHVYYEYYLLPDDMVVKIKTA